jgi:hypothetical protein
MYPSLDFEASSSILYSVDSRGRESLSASTPSCCRSFMLIRSSRARALGSNTSCDRFTLLSYFSALRLFSCFSL